MNALFLYLSWSFNSVLGSPFLTFVLISLIFAWQVECWLYEQQLRHTCLSSNNKISFKYILKCVKSYIFSKVWMLIFLSCKTHKSLCLLQAKFTKSVYK